MPLDNLPGKLVTLTRDQRRDRYLRDFSIRNPSAATGPGSEAYLDASVFADATDVHVSSAITIANGVTRATATGQALIDWAKRMGTDKLPAVGGAGAVAITAATGGTTIFQGDVAVHTATGLRYRCTATGSYQNSSQVPIIGIDTGPGTNLNAGTVLTWVSPRPGCGSTASVVQQSDGSGLSGGSDVESDDQLRARLDYIAANPPASGNEGEYQQAVATTPLLSVQQAFIYPAIRGPGSKGVAFTLRPSQPGASRIPSSTQNALMLASLQGQMPGDDGVYALVVNASQVVVVLKVLWAQGSAGWADVSPFPNYIASPNLVSAAAPASGGITPTSFRLSSATNFTGPSVGQSIAFLDLPNLRFRRKKVLTVTNISSSAYDVTVDTSSGVSDTSYAPTSGQACCPWSDSLGTLITPVVSYFDTLGPGEMFASFFDPGLRQRRSPVSPQYWPSQITNRLIGGGSVPVPPSGPQQNNPPVQTLLTTTSIQDVVLQEPTIPYITPIGSPAVSVNLLTLSNLLAFPE